MKQDSRFHVVFVGWDEQIVRKLWRVIAQRSECRFSFVMHPRHVAANFRAEDREDGLFFFRDRLRQEMPEPDYLLLASLEADGVPTLHNMILGDRVIATLEYEEALSYATFLARRLTSILCEVGPSVVIGSFDAIHSGIALAVARKLDIPWFALNFSVIPPGLACFCDRMSPNARVQVGHPDLIKIRAFAERALSRFESKDVAAPAYVTPPALSFGAVLQRLPRRIASATRTIQRRRDRESLKYTQDRTDFSLLAALTHLFRTRVAHGAIAKFHAHSSAPARPFVLFGLHMQPESSVDVWAPFFSKQIWVIETLSRSMPPSHRLLVKIHKSDAANYSTRQLRHMLSLPGVELIEPFADARVFVEAAALVVSIQGTMGLEAALLGKPVIMLGDSPVTLFPSASPIGTIADLPALVRKKMAQSTPERRLIVDAYAKYLSPFMPASHNDWLASQSDSEIQGYVELFSALEKHLSVRGVAAAEWS